MTYTIKEAAEEEIPRDLLEETICDWCRGSGEGRGGSLICSNCRGAGTVFTEIETEE